MRITDPRFQEILTEPREASFSSTEKDVFSNQAKNFLKRWPKFFNFLKKTIGPSNSPGNRYNVSERIQKRFKNNLQNVIILNLGSGTDRIHPEVINIDLFPFKEVDLVADITHLPFKSNVADAIICDTVLEHVADISNVLDEIERVLKPQGALYISVPFMYPYHSSPDDFHRWTGSGLRRLLEERKFKVLDVGPMSGPMGTLQSVLMHFFAIILCFGSERAYFLWVQFWMLALSPLKILDYLFIHSRFSIEVASHLFIVGEKHE
jgi:SAM-dependent methyltransferase